MIDPTRRGLLKIGLLGASALILPWSVHGRRPSKKAKRLNMICTHTGTRFNDVFWEDGKFIDDSLKKLNYLLRDHRANKIHPIDKNLLLGVHGLMTKVGNHNELALISGFRTQQTNRALHGAKRSQHLQGKAVDIRLKGTALHHLHKAALTMRCFGTGYYPRSNFLHIDTGNVRCWRGR